MPELSSGRRVVLVGAGHAHLEVLRRWGMQPPPGMQLTCVSPHGVSTYSGMLPGVLAGQYARQQMEIDLNALCARSGAQLQIGSFRGIDIQERVVRCHGGLCVPFDVLSFNVGSSPRLPARHGRAGVIIPVKPMATFLERLSDGLVLGGRSRSHADPIRIAVIGGGVGAVEIALCLPVWVQSRLESAAADVSLIGGQPRLVPELS
ncbi:MAG: FAD-dependent oxidoreductase, partial [Planctomycetaceae bacterium]